MWDKLVITDRRAQHNKLDILIHNKTSQSCQIIDVAILMDANVNHKIADKLTKYNDLKIEQLIIHDLSNMEVILIVIGALGTTTQTLPEYAQKISTNADLDLMIKTTLLGTAHIIRNFFA